MPLRTDELLMVLETARGSKDNPDYEDDRRRAVEAHRRVLREKGYLQSQEGKFMSEIDSPCPDLLLRSMYRKALLNSQVKGKDSNNAQS